MINRRLTDDEIIEKNEIARQKEMKLENSVKNFNDTLNTILNHYLQEWKKYSEMYMCEECYCIFNQARGFVEGVYRVGIVSYDEYKYLLDATETMI